MSDSSLQDPRPSRSAQTQPRPLKPTAPRRGGLGKKLFGATALGALALGIFLGQYLPDLGFLPGGKGLGLGQPATPQGMKQSEETPTTPGETPARTGAKPQSRKPGDAPVTVRIEGHDLILEDGTGQSQTVTLDEVVKAIQSATPNPEGLRVKIAPTPEARAKAESDLKEALRSAGIPETEILWSE